jgi:excisionase family DNA binding protein
MPEPIPQLLTLLAIAQKLSVSPHTIRAWVRQGKLRPVRICRRLLFHPDEICRLLEKSREVLPRGA